MTAEHTSAPDGASTILTTASHAELGRMAVDTLMRRTRAGEISWQRVGEISCQTQEGSYFASTPGNATIRLKWSRFKEVVSLTWDSGQSGNSAVWEELPGWSKIGLKDLADLVGHTVEATVDRAALADLGL